MGMRAGKTSKIPTQVKNYGYESRKMSKIPTQVMNYGYDSRKNKQDTHASDELWV